jgi:hypothetical protein
MIQTLNFYVVKKTLFIQPNAQQVIGRERETATFLSRCVVSLSLSVAVSRHVNAAVMLFCGAETFYL